LAGALVLLALAGATGAYVITVSATFITWVPNDIRGSAGGLYRTGLRVAQGVGVGIGGLVAQWLGSADTTIALAGVVGLLLAVPVALAWRRAGGPRPEPQLS
jgi:predicted MFS family arabinose efflux permease